MLSALSIYFAPSFPCGFHDDFLGPACIHLGACRRKPPIAIHLENSLGESIQGMAMTQLIFVPVGNDRPKQPLTIWHRGRSNQSIIYIDIYGYEEVTPKRYVLTIAEEW